MRKADKVSKETPEYIQYLKDAGIAFLCIAGTGIAIGLIQGIIKMIIWVVNLAM